MEVLVQMSTATPSSNRDSMIVVDAVGSIFATLRTIGLNQPLWRVTAARRLPAMPEDALAICAVYQRTDWRIVNEVVDCARTIIVADRFDAEDALTAFDRGLFGYLDMSQTEEGLRRSLTAAA